MRCERHEHTDANCIEIVPIFSGLTNEEMLEIAAITRERTYQKGEAIYSAGKIEKNLYVIHAGQVRISRLSQTGKVQVIRDIGPGEFMGELTILNELPLKDYAEAVEPCRLCLIEGVKLKNLMQKYPSIALKVLQELSSRLEKAEGLIEDIHLHSAEQRLSQALLQLSGGKREFELSQTKGSLASMLGMTQETLSRKLSLFREQGLIGLKGQRGIIIYNRERLAEISSE